MNEDQSAAATTGNGFRISARPLVGESRASASRETLARATSADLLYVIARDPQTLFLYWDLDWKRLFARAGLSPRQVHLRIFRGDGSIEGTREINPFRGHCYAEVAGAGTEYFCELGSFDGTAWAGLVRSGTTATPEATISDDLSGEFATLPIHLSFQKLLDLLGARELDGTMLARSVAELQENARVLQSRMAPGDWSQLAPRIAARLNGAKDNHAAEMAELIEIALRSEAPAAPTGAEFARWKELVERSGGSSWSGASHGGFGGSSAA